MVILVVLCCVCLCRFL